MSCVLCLWRLRLAGNGARIVCVHFGCAAQPRAARVESRHGGAVIAITVIRKRANTAFHRLTGGGITCRQALRLRLHFYLSSPNRYTLLTPMHMPGGCWQNACFDLLTGGRYPYVCLQVLFVDNSDTVRARVAAGVFERIADWYAQLQKPFLSIRVQKVSN